MSDLERTESADLDVLLALQGLFNRLQEGVDNASAVLLGNHRPSGA
jgi:hypothetical protein